MQIIILFVTFFSAAQSIHPSIRKHWEKYKLVHDKEYNSTDEELYRLNNFLENKRIVAHHNKRHELGFATYKMRLNEYSDMHSTEFKQIMFPTIMDAEEKSHKNMNAFEPTFMAPANVEIPESVDWRKLGAVTPMNNQARCGSCWAYSAIGTLEGQYFRKTGILVPLSVQNMMDCSSVHGGPHYDCGGGSSYQGLRYVQLNGGINSEKHYPYEASNVAECNYDSRYPEAKISGIGRIPDGDEEKLKVAVATIGPMSIYIYAPLPFALYGSGIFNDPSCDNTKKISHAVLVIGYGKSYDGTPYWIIKNSWGMSWGKRGYMKIIRGKNHCNLASGIYYPIM